MQRVGSTNRNEQEFICDSVPISYRVAGRDREFVCTLLDRAPYRASEAQKRNQPWLRVLYPLSGGLPIETYTTGLSHSQAHGCVAARTRHSAAIACHG